MGLCCLYSNQCAYANCGLFFANQYDLIAHVEFNHIPVVEAEMKRKTEEAIARGEAPTTSTNMPLSCVSKVFRKAYNPKPIQYEGIKVSFNHYKRRPVSESVRRQQEQLRQLQDQIDPFDNRKVGDIDFTECQPEDPEMRFLCSSQQCIKRYKNIYALKAHMKSVHQLVLGDTMAGGPVVQEVMTPLLPPVEKPFLAPAPVVLAAQTAAPPAPVRAPVVTQKCPYCTRRYKTDIGLKNHLIQVHQKSDPPDEPSQEVLDQLINQAKVQGQKERMQQYAQSQLLRESLLPTKQMKLSVSLDGKIDVEQRVQQKLSPVKLIPLTTSQSIKLSQTALLVQQKQQQRPTQTYQVQYQSLPPQRQPATQMPQLKRMTPVKLFQQAPQQHKHPQQTVVRKMQFQASECQPSTSTAINYYEQPMQPTNQPNQNPNNQQL